eukprot:4253144-Prymnesium_polylepis.1
MEGDSDTYVADKFAPKLLMWLNEAASPGERKLFHDWLTDLRAFHQSLEAAPNILERASPWLSWRPAPKVLPKIVQEEKGVSDKKGAVALLRRSATQNWSNRKSGKDDVKKKALAQVLKRVVTAKEFKLQKAALLRSNAVQQQLADLMEETNCEGVVLIPIAKMADGQEVPRIVIASSLYGDEPSKDQKKIEGATGWDCCEGSPTGLCKSSRAAVNITNLICDCRFPDHNYATLKRKAIGCLSQLVVPIFEGGGAANDAEDDSVGSTLVGIIQLFNKVSFDGRSSGVAFERFDEILAGVYATLVVECMSTSANTSQKLGFMSKLEKAMDGQRAKRSITGIQRVERQRSSLKLDDPSDDAFRSSKSDEFRSVKVDDMQVEAVTGAVENHTQEDEMITKEA